MRRDCTVDDLAPIDFACLDSIYFAVCGLAQGYGYLGVRGWIDEKQGGFRPAVESCLKLQRMVRENLAKLGLDKPPKELDPWEQLDRNGMWDEVDGTDVEADLGKPICDSVGQ